MLPVIVLAVGLRWVSGLLHAITSAVRRRALGDMAARAIPGGPADVRDLATSLNFLADEGGRIRAAEGERARLQAGVRQASVRIREHLRGEAIIREAVTVIHEHLPVDFVWVGVVTGDQLTLADGDPGAGGQVSDIVAQFPPGSVGWIRDIYRHRSSYRIQDLRAAQGEEIPAEIKKILLSQGATSLLLTPFGAGHELLGCLTLLRTSLRQVWTQPEIDAVESAAGQPAVECREVHPRGGTVTLALDNAEGSAVLRVADTGIGIPEKDQGSLFTRFFRASNAVEAAIPGSGLGLSIVRTIVANHHGDLSIESVVDQGTTVTVRLPLHNGAVPAHTELRGIAAAHARVIGHGDYDRGRTGSPGLLREHRADQLAGRCPRAVRAATVRCYERSSVDLGAWHAAAAGPNAASLRAAASRRRDSAGPGASPRTPTPPILSICAPPARPGEAPAREAMT